MAGPILTFTSDFGHRDWFVGVVHGVIHEHCPEARIVDLTHEVLPGRVARAAFVLEAACPDFPPGTIHLAVIDPGVGTDRRGLAVRAHGQTFVGPDNGLLEWAFRDPKARIRELVEPSFFRQPVSRTFHGRDVFAPVAAHLACGVAFDSLGPAVEDPVRLGAGEAQLADGRLIGRVMWIDRFGNALTNLRDEAVRGAFPGVDDERLQVRVVDRTIRGLSRSYGDSGSGALVAIMGSSGRLEIAVVNGDVAWRFGIGEGDEVAVRVAPERPAAG
jgi:S-adenosyl-L-methionine hydrolase (adenosine-forming)